MLRGGRLRLNNTNNRAPLKNYPNNVKKMCRCVSGVTMMRLQLTSTCYNQGVGY